MHTQAMVLWIDNFDGIENIIEIHDQLEKKKNIVYDILEENF